MAGGTVFAATEEAALSAVEKQFGVSYTDSAIVELLKRLDYRFKQPDVLPSKADPEKQAA